MAHIQKRLSARGPRYTVQVRRSGVVATQTFSTLQEARAWASEIERAARLADQGLGPLAVEFSRGMTLAQAVARYTATVTPGLATADEITTQLNTWAELLGPDTPLKALTTADIISARETLRARRKTQAAPRPGQPPKPPAPRLTSATVNRYLAALRRMLNVAVREWQVLRVNPAAAVSALREPGGRMRWLNDAERAALLTATAASPDPDLHLAVLVSLSTALRRGELLAIEYRDLDLDAGLLTLRAEITKTNRPRVLNLPPRVHAMLAERARGARPGDHIFPGQAERFRKSFADACTAARLTDFRWHDLRHTAASYLAMQGASPREIAEITGHQTLSMVMRYTHLSSAHSRALSARLEDRVFDTTAALPPPED